MQTQLFYMKTTFLIDTAHTYPSSLLSWRSRRQKSIQLSKQFLGNSASNTKTMGCNKIIKTEYWEQYKNPKVAYYTHFEKSDHTGPSPSLKIIFIIIINIWMKQRKWLEKECNKIKFINLINDINDHTLLHFLKGLLPECINFLALVKNYHQASQPPQELHWHEKLGTIETKFNCYYMQINQPNKA